jgi:hypothetical protein
MKKSNLLTSMAVVILTACGGSGSSAPTTTPPTTGNTVTSPVSPATVSNTTKAHFDAGVFYFGGAYRISNGVPLSYIRKASNSSTRLFNGNTRISIEDYAGDNSIEGTHVLNYVRFRQMGLTNWTSTISRPELSYGPDNTTTLINTHAKSEMAESVKWGLTITTEDLAGTSINVYLQSLRIARAIPAVTGDFGTGAMKLSLTYTSHSDLLVTSLAQTAMRDHHFDPITTMAGLLNSTSCLRNINANQHLVMRYQSNGSIDLYNTSALPAQEQCTANPPLATAIGTASYVQKPFGANSYLEISFPSSVDLSPFMTLIDKAALDAGAKLAIGQPLQGNWMMGYFIPKGVALTDPDKYMNQAAADAVKAALGLR